MLKLFAVVTSVLTIAALGITSPVSAQEESAKTISPRVMGGTPATGNSGVVALAIFDGQSWSGSCSAALWKPDLLITNAHCTTIDGTGQGAAGFAVFPPGITAFRYSNFLQNPSPLSVVNVWRADGYVNATSSVEPNDIAVLQLNGNLGPTPFTRLATTEELTRWTAQRAMVDHVGYGLVGPNQFSFDPSQVSLPITNYVPDSRLGNVFRTGQTLQQGICSGDSGSPVSRQDQAGNVLLGVVAGGSGPCVNAANGSPNNVNVAAIGYLPLLNRALEATGRPTIPSAPQQISGRAVNRSITVSWQPPAISPQTVVGYDVVNTAGEVVCSTTELQCAVNNIPDGTYGFTVRARNSEGEGDTPAISNRMTATIASPTQMAAPFIRTRPSGSRVIAFTTLAGRTSAVISQYVVTDAKGKRVCRVVPNSAQQNASTLTCPLPKKTGIYRFRVTAVTEMGRTPPSALSPRINVR
jgi:hypothetical protein